MTDAKDSHHELPLWTPDEVAERLRAGLTAMARQDLENHDARVRMHIERMKQNQLRLTGANAVDEQPGEIIHLDMDPYLVKLRPLHGALKRMVADGHYVTPTVAAILDALETDP